MERGEFGERDGAEEMGDLLALPGHDFVELVGHEGVTKHAVATEDKAEKFPAPAVKRRFDMGALDLAEFRPRIILVTV